LPDGVIRTPEERFNILFDFSFKSNYVTINDGIRDLRVHYIDEGPRDGEILLCLHGQPTWSYLYRKMIGPLTAAGYRVIAPDLIGFGKSDKLTSRSDYTYASHVLWLEKFVLSLSTTKLTLIGQDWGGERCKPRVTN
jgi:haloalkane dehalogenase